MASGEDFQFVICPVLGSTPIGDLELTDVQWNDPVYGPGAGFTAKAAITKTQPRDKLYELTEPDTVALYVKDSVNGTYLFGGPVVARPWDRESRKLVISAQSWKAWTYHKLCGMNRGTNPVSNRAFTYLNTDQLAIARSLLSAVLAGEPGCPVINIGTELSGILRDLNFNAWDQKYLGAQIDSMANRDNGFEWTIEVRPASNGNPALWFVPAFPSRGGLNNRLLLLHEEAQGGNILALPDPEESAGERRSRVWTTGPGQPPAQMVAYDEDPALTNGFLLLRETVRSYNNGITKIETLADHARTERVYRASTLQQVVLEVGLRDPDFRIYNSGDKVGLRVTDEWLRWDFSSVRILDRAVKINRTDKPDIAALMIDLNDVNLPENEAVV